MRSTKDGMTGSLLPPLTHAIVRLPFQQDHQAAYNAFIEVRLLVFETPLCQATSVPG